MKKLFTLLFIFGSLTSGFAQYNNDNRNGRQDRDENNTAYESKGNNGSYSRPMTGPDVSGRNNDKRDYSYNDNRYNGSFSMSSRERDYQAQKINREYNYKISSVNANRYLRSRERDFQIRNLEKQRRDELCDLDMRYNDRRNRYHRW